MQTCASYRRRQSGRNQRRFIADRCQEFVSKELMMTQANLKAYRLGWGGTGRMGYAMALRLLKNGCDVAVYNRTRAKADPLAAVGATIVDSPADLAERDIVFTMVSGPDDLIEVVTGGNGILSRPNRAPKMLVDCL